MARRFDLAREVAGRSDAAYTVAIVAIALVLAYGSPLMRFSLLWMVAAVAPAAFFTWDNVSRDLYLPSAAFALLLAAGTAAAAHAFARRAAPTTVRGVTIAASAALLVRFAVFATLGADGIPARAAAYERFAAALHRSAATAAAGDIVTIDARERADVPFLYRQPAADTVYWADGIRIAVR